jgi:gamma-glutamylputrescine oxidase
VHNLPYWLEANPPDPPAPLDRDIRANAVVIGGGIAGLTVAQLLSARGADVVLLEGSFCGSGATGRSSGFITPDSELQVAQLEHRFGARDAALLWRAAAAACDHIQRTIVEHDIACDFVKADSLYAATSGQSAQTTRSEHEARLRAGLPSSHYAGANIDAVLGANGFTDGVRYGGTFAMTPYLYATGLRDRLRAAGVPVYENSPVQEVTGDDVITAGGRVRAERIFFCADRDLASVGRLRAAAYYAQTFLAATAPLPEQLFRSIFPDGDLLVWDTDLIYHYFRRTADDRLLVGGGQLRNTSGPPVPGATGVPVLCDFIRRHLPQFAGIPFANAWSGLIGVTKDLLPLAGPDPSHPGSFYAGCAAGLPWSVLAAQCAVASSEGRDELQRFLDPGRVFTDLDPIQPVAGKRLTFALSHGYAKGALKGSAEDVRSRRPYVIGAALALLGGLLAAWVRLTRRARRK